DSLLLGKLNISLLKLLLTGVEKELDIEYVSHISKNWKYCALILSAHPVEINVVSHPIQRYVV
ncbi:hypothetical protein Tco_1222123, partial [Tanacetum coccineum]